MGGDGDALDNNAITIVDACCCSYDGCLFTDGCLGCMGSSTCCCCESEFCLKSGAPTLCCICCALPCDDEVPCMVGTLGLICYPSFGCCRTLGAITGKGESGDPRPSRLARAREGSAA